MMSISVIGASSKQMRQMRNKTELTPSHSQEKCKECLMGGEHVCVEMVDGPHTEKVNQMSIPYLHKKVEKELKEKQRKITLLRQGISQSPTLPPKPISIEPKNVKDEESGCTYLSSWSRSRPLLIMSIFCTLVILIVILIIIVVLIAMK